MPRIHGVRSLGGPHGHGGGHHHGGGGGGWRGGPGWYGGPWYPNTSEVFVVADECTGYDPVLATDGRTYDNACLARRAGASVVRRVRPVAGVGDISTPILNYGALAFFGYLIYTLVKK
jgi:hypothetical protein